MNMLRMTQEQIDAHKARIGSARVIKGKSTQDETRGPKVKKPPKTARISAPRKPRQKYEYEKHLALQLAAMGFREFEVDARYLRDRLHRGDVVFRRERLIVEVQGQVHRIRNRWKEDIEKAQLTVLAGWRLLPVSTKQVRDGSAADLVKRALDVLTRGECHGVKTCPDRRA